MNRTLLLTFILISGIWFSFKKDNDVLEKIAHYLEKYYQTYPEEKVFIQTDKPFYVAGEVIWFKAYLVEALSLTLDSVSIPLYVEWIEPNKGEVLQRKILKLNGGIGQGDFEINANTLPGDYSIRAYTNWMRNFKEDLFFIKNIKVINTTAIEKNQIANEDKVDMQFFPEGGTLIEGFENRIAFKAMDATGKGVDLFGKIVSSTGDTIARFKSDHIGMGTFKIKPESTITYKAIIQFKNIYSSSYDLPIAQSKGMNLTIDNVSSPTKVRLAVNNNLPTESVYIVGQSRGVIFYAGIVPVGTANAFISVAKEKFPPGIAQFTLFDQSMRPYCERIIFVPDREPLDIKVTTDKTVYHTREKSNLTLQVRDQLGQPVKGSFSISVVDESQVKDFSQVESIQSYLLLNSDIKGHIDNPFYYFDKSNKYAALHLDLLLMTQGWRRFTWQEVIQNQLLTPKFLIEKGLVISGMLTPSSGKPFDQSQNLTLMIGRDTNQQFLMGSTNPDGSFLFYGLDFYDTTEVFAQALNTEPPKNVTVNLHYQYFASITNSNIPNNPFQPINDDFSTYLLNSKQAIDYEKQLKLNDAIWLSEISVQARKKQKPSSGPKALYSHPDQVIHGDISPSALNVLDMIKGRVAGVQISGDRSNPKVVIRGGSSMSLGGEPLYLFDGNPVSKETVLALDVNSVDRVEVVKSLASGVMYGDQAKNGIISVFSKVGIHTMDSPLQSVDRGNTTSIYQGYYAQKQFYAPRYDKGQNQSSIPDLRSTIHWSPDVNTDESGTSTIEYFNTDAPATVRVYVEGLSNNGKLGMAIVNYRVVK